MLRRHYSPVRVATPSEETGETASKDAKCPTKNCTSRVPDGGWGWLVAGGSFIITMLMPLMSQGFGVVFSRYLLQEASSSTVNSWIYNIQSSLWNLMGLMVRPLSEEFGWRAVGITGALLAFTALMLSAFTPSPVFLFFSYSLLSGMGGGLAVCLSFVIVPLYFERRRGVANAMMMAGVCTGQIAGPPFLRFLQDEYGYRGAMLIMAATLLNCCAGAALFHPVEWHLKEPSQSSKSLWTEPVVMNAGEANREGGEEAEWVTQTRSRGEDGTQRDGEKSTNMKCKQDIEQAAGAPRPGVGLKALVARVVSSTVTDLAIMKSPRALIIAFASAFFLNGYYNFIMMVPFAMQTAGHGLADAANCISASAFANLVMRIMTSGLSDCAWFNMRFAYMTGIALTTVSTLVFPLLESVPWLMVTMTIVGAGVGITMGLYNLVMVKFMGLDNFAPTFGAVSFTLAVSFLTIGPFVGVVRDTSGSYSSSMWLSTGFISVSFILWVFMPNAQAYDRRRMEAEAVAL